MSYREHAPPPALVPWLECTWERRGDGLPVRVLPDGCIDVIWTEGAETQLVGANTTAFVVPVAAGTRIVGARFHPGAAPALLGIAAEEFRDARTSAEEVWRGDGARLTTTLEAGGDPLQGLVRWLLARLRHAEQPDPIVHATVQRLRRSFRPEVARLADELALSERQLRRRVAAAVGYGPKRLARILRLYDALAAARAGDDLARVAYDAGYADQAHFANECRVLAGAPATVLIADWTARGRFLQDGPRRKRDHRPDERS
jgi:AraC-like DNA-binding protein